MSDAGVDPAAVHGAIRDEVARVLVGKEGVVEGLSIALFTRGHVLLEGVPGVAKTTIANLSARASGLEYNRIQMTPDVLPADVTGTTVYRESTGEFELQRGPVFSNVVVADEINRATPKTQSALLEAMQERTVTIEGRTLDLPDPFVVIATQNPIEMEGTFELPEAQRDRFLFKLVVDIPNHDEESRLLDAFDADPELGPADIGQVVAPDDLRAARGAVADVYVAPAVKEYILALVEETRSVPETRHGGSPRASLAFLNAAKARAAIRGRDYVIPDDVKALAQSILAHRLVLSTDAELSDRTTRDVVDDVVSTVEPPGSGEVAETEDDAVADAPAVGDGGDPDPGPDPSTNHAFEGPDDPDDLQP